MWGINCFLCIGSIVIVIRVGVRVDDVVYLC
jgi:hypothetical protein